MIADAVAILRRGGLVAFPTETVYGLGADAVNAQAVLKIFAAKGRPSTNPLIVHVASPAVARRYCRNWPAMAETLAARFWPGPLTLVLPKTPAIVAEVSAGGETIGLRVPNHPVALELLTAFDGPIAAPSANRSNQVSPTEAAHVKSEIGDSVDLVLDGGPCAVGIESTVLDLAGDQPRILRPGGISRAEIESVIGPILIFEGHVDSATTAISPGQHLRHYSPRTPAFRFSPAEWQQASARVNRPAVVMAISDVAFPGCGIRKMPDDAIAYAQEFYRTLRELDTEHLAAIYMEWPTGDEQWDAVRDRIRRATMPIVTE
jgi:L-threonylcarbamoyladenylate synthase